VTVSVESVTNGSTLSDRLTQRQLAVSDNTAGHVLSWRRRQSMSKLAHRQHWWVLSVNVVSRAKLQQLHLVGIQAQPTALIHACTAWIQVENWWAAWWTAPIGDDT